MEPIAKLEKTVTPAKAGVQKTLNPPEADWIPAYAGMTTKDFCKSLYELIKWVFKAVDTITAHAFLQRR